MNLKYVMSIGIVCIISLGSLFFFQGTSTQDLNRDFKIETLRGDASVLDDFSFSAIIQESPTNFSRVTLTSDGASIESILYDYRHGFDERQLENRELFRGASWAEIIETDHFTFSHRFDSSYVWNTRHEPTARIAILNHETGNVDVFNPLFPEINPTIPIWWTFLIEDNGTFYYVLPTETNELFVYQIHPESLTFEFLFQKDLSSLNRQDAWINWREFDGSLYAEVFNSMGTTSDVFFFNVQNQQLEELNSEIDFFNNWVFGRRNQEFYFTHFPENTNLPTLNRINLETDEVTELPVATFTEDLEGMGFQNFSIVDDYLIGIYHEQSMRPMAQFIVIYDLNTLEIIYEGRINLRLDQGLLEQWGTIQGFNLDPIR